MAEALTMFVFDENAVTHASNRLVHVERLHIPRGKTGEAAEEEEKRMDKPAAACRHACGQNKARAENEGGFTGAALIGP